jgi:predicted RNA-binding protein (TIGR00451 family)
MHFAWVLTYGDGPRLMETGSWFHENNRFGGGFVAQFKGMTLKRSDGAPHRHDLGTPKHLIKPTMPKDDSPRPPQPCMASEWSIRKRRPVRRKNIAPLLKTLENDLNIDLNVDGAFLEMAEYGPWTMVFVDRVPLVIELLNEAEERCVFLTLRGFLQHLEARKWVEVDHGAIPFLMNGADCMVAGVHGAEVSVEAGDLVWVRDMTHKRPLALGWALNNAEGLVSDTKGKGIKTLHWVGDELWEME